MDMRKYTSLVIVCSVIILLGQIMVTTDVTRHEVEGNNDSSVADVTGFNFVPDSSFTYEPEIVVNGTSDEFSSNYHQADNESDFNYMELTWEHEANTSLDFKNETIENLPDCNDFIYFYQVFDWPYNEKPPEVNFTFSYATTLTGDFAVPPGNLMFRIYAWLIDSSGNWIVLYESKEATYTEIYLEKRAFMSYADIEDVWDGMIENSTGWQEDPEDSVQIAVGLSPRLTFENYLETEPWTFYDGLVSFRIKNMRLWVYGDFVEDPYPSSSTTTTTTITTSTSTITTDITTGPELPLDIIILGVTGASIVTIAVIVYLKKYK